MNEYTELLDRLGELSQEAELLKMSGSDTGEGLAEIESEISDIEDRLGILQRG